MGMQMCKLYLELWPIWVVGTKQALKGLKKKTF